MKKTLLLFLSITFCAAAGQTAVELDPAHTEIKFTLHDPLHTVHGTFQLKSGNIQFDPETGKASGEMVIDMTSGASGNGLRDKRMQKDILESPKYPEAVFTPDRVEGRMAGQGASEIDVHGIFCIHGGNHELTLHLQVQPDGGQYVASTHFTIPYVQWGMKNPSNFLLKVDDKVELDVRAVTR